MALNTNLTKEKKRHRDRKNPHARDLFNRENQGQNSRRPKQRWVGGDSVATGGYWTRETT